MKALVDAFNQKKALVGAFYVITNLRMELFEALQEIRAQLRGEVVFVGVHCRRTRAVNEPSQCFVMPRENPYKALLLFESTYYSVIFIMQPRVRACKLGIFRSFSLVFVLIP